MSRPEYIPLSDDAAPATARAASRHAALIEDAFNVLIETPGGGVSINGDAKSRAGAKQVVAALAAQADSGREVTEADVRVAIGAARAGTGKTFLAVAHGAGLLLRGEVDRLIVSRPAVEAGERLGFLPGDMNEKVDPYMAPVWEALTDIIGAEQLRRRREKGEIEVAPIAFLRGRPAA